MKNEQQSQNLLLKVDPRSTFHFFNPQQLFLSHDKLITQGEKRETSTKTFLGLKMPHLQSQALHRLDFLKVRFRCFLSWAHDLVACLSQPRYRDLVAHFIQLEGDLWQVYSQIYVCRDTSSVYNFSDLVVDGFY